LKLNKFIPHHLLFLFFTYLTGILFFTAFRITLLLNEVNRLNDLPQGESFVLLLNSFFMGFRFDTVISGYILSIPFIMLLITSTFRFTNRIISRIIFWYLFVLYCVAFLICAADIPYFNQFFARFNVSAFLWAETPGFVTKMIIQEFRYWWTFIPFIIFCFLFYKLLRRITKLYLMDNPVDITGNRILFFAKNLILTLLAGLILFVGMRGRISKKSPIRVGTAYFSNYAFPNQLGLNPVFTFLRSYLNSRNEENKQLNLIDPNVAIKNVRKYLNFENYIDSISPIARNIMPDSILPNKPNVVIVIMESMSAAKMGMYGNTNNLTPVLDSLASTGYAFDNVYTAGIHTYNGVYGTLFSYPAVGRFHPMKGVEILKYNGIASTLKQHGYSSIYFTTHDSQFDNAGGFLSANDYGQIISQKDFPSNKILSTLGVPDDYLFEFSIPILNKLHEKNKPFLAAFMTASDHGPYIIPDYFFPKSDNVRQQIVEYADWSIGKFIQLSSEQEWFNNTLFVFIADHGSPMNSVYDMPLNYFHTPLIFYGPNVLEENRSFDCFGGQIDVFPTILGILGLPYVNNTFGIDLTREERHYTYFYMDDKYGVINQEFFLVVRENGLSSLYKYPEKDTKNYLEDLPDIVDVMDTYAKSHIQAAQWIIQNKKTMVETRYKTKEPR